MESLLDRSDLLAYLRDTPRTKGGLIDDLGVSRTTIDRAVEQLESLDIVADSPAGYRPTATGTVATDRLHDLADDLADASPNGGSRTDTATTLDVLAVVFDRLDLLELLVEEPRTKPDLVAALDVSRSTVDRGLRRLETAGVIEYTDGRFVLTAMGERAVAGLGELQKTLQRRQELAPLLQWVPDETLDIDLAALAEAELVVPAAGDPWAMVNRHVQLLRRLEDGRAILPLTGLHACEALHERVVDAGATFEVVVTRDVADTFTENPEYAPLTEAMLATDRYDVYVHEGPIPYYLGLIDDTIQLGVDEDGEPRALLETGQPAVAEWATDKYTTFRDQAEPLV